MATTAATERSGFAGHIREVTDEEVAHFREHGWVALFGFVSEELAGETLEHIKAITGLDYDEFPTDPAEQAAFMAKVAEMEYAGVMSRPRTKDPWLMDYVTSPELGRAAGALLGQKSLRILSDSVICKLPAESGKSRETAYHQDFCPMAIDRAIGIQFWLALCPITPEMGSMQHLSGSHHEPPLGRCHYAGDQSLLEIYPDLTSNYPLAPAHTFRPGDVLAHDILTVHYAQENETNKLRWAYTSYRIASHTLYTGAPNPWTDDLGLTVDRPLDHPLFPIVTDA